METNKNWKCITCKIPYEPLPDNGSCLSSHYPQTHPPTPKQPDSFQPNQRWHAKPNSESVCLPLKMTIHRASSPVHPPQHSSAKRLFNTFNDRKLSHIRWYHFKAREIKSSSPRYLTKKGAWGEAVEAEYKLAVITSLQFICSRRIITVPTSQCCCGD